MHIDITPAAQGRLAVSGVLTFATARRADAIGLAAIAAASGGQLEIDCGAVTAADSAGFAVLIDWLAAARRKRLELRFTNLPEQIRAVARISEMEDWLAGAQ